MSGSGKKKKGVASGVKGWEEAGGEFYQECYPGVEVDLEVMKSDPQRISTLLPSKKNRTGINIAFIMSRQSCSST